MRTNKTETKIWDHFQAARLTLRVCRRGFYFATCPDCRIIFSMKDAREQEEIEKNGCSICRSLKRGKVAA